MWSEEKERTRRRQPGSSPLARGRSAVAGFTLAEVLAAMLFMAIVIPAAVEGLRIASRAGAATERRSIATQLADSRLNEWIVTGDWRSADPSGDFGNQWPGYRWTFRNETWSGDANLNNMRLLTIEVSYPSQSENASVRLSALIQDTE